MDLTRFLRYAFQIGNFAADNRTGSRVENFADDLGDGYGNRLAFFAAADVCHGNGRKLDRNGAVLDRHGVDFAVFDRQLFDDDLFTGLCRCGRSLGFFSFRSFFLGCFGGVLLDIVLNVGNVVSG